MYVNATDFRNEFSKYLELAETNNIYIVRHGRVVARLSGSYEEKRKMLDSITGIVDYKGDPEEIFKMRLDEL